MLKENHYAKFDGYIDWLVECEQLEVQGFEFGNETTFNLPRLKTLALKRVECEQLTIDCPSLESLIIWSILERVRYRSIEQLKYLECNTHKALNFEPNTVFKSLESLNVNDKSYFLHSERERRRELLRCMPALKKLICYSNGIRRSFLTEIQNWKQEFGLNDLRVSVSGFENGLIIYSGNSDSSIMLTEQYVEPVFNNYTRLVDSNCSWDVLLDYDELFANFKILPANFFVNFPNIYCVKISNVTSYTHLFGFLKLCPSLDNLELNRSLTKIKPEFLDLLHLLTPSLRFLMVEEDYFPRMGPLSDFMFLRNLKLTVFFFTSTSKWSLLVFSLNEIRNGLRNGPVKFSQLTH